MIFCPLAERYVEKELQCKNNNCFWYIIESCEMSNVDAAMRCPISCLPEARLRDGAPLEHRKKTEQNVPPFTSRGRRARHESRSS